MLIMIFILNIIQITYMMYPFIMIHTVMLDIMIITLQSVMVKEKFDLLVYLIFIFVYNL